jgi:hypothetical protein
VGCAEDNAKTIATSGGIEAVARAMTVHADNNTVQKMAVKAIENVVWNIPAHIATAKAAGVVPLLQRAAGQGVEDAAEQLKRMEAADVREAEAAGDCAGVVALMRAGAGDAAVQKEGCNALWSLAFNDDYNRVAIGKAGGVQVVVGAMELHKGIAAVQKEGCMALETLARNNDDNSVAIAEAGGVQAVVEAMKLHQDSAALQENGCDALRILAINGKKTLFR